MGRAARRSSRAVTIAMVAERAGVSAMTVSNVLNGQKRVNEAKRSAVLAAVEALNYVPNPAARALASAAPAQIGLLYHDPQVAYLSALLLGALNATRRLGAQLLLQHAPQADVGAALEALRTLKRSGANAFLLPAPFCELLGGSADLAALGLPVVALAPGADLPGLPGVRIDDFAAARELTERLLQLGHRRIAFIGGPSAHSASRSRMDGYRAALEGRGIPFDPVLSVPGAFTFESGLAAAGALLTMTPRPTAIFAANDDMAAAVVSAAHRMGLHIPADLSVVGFDDTPIATRIWPTLTTVRQPVALISEAAVEALVDVLKSPAEPPPLTSRLLPYEIIERDSTGPLVRPPLGN